jgi:precorrin-3B methylase
MGIVTNAYRVGQNIAVTNLGRMLEHAMDMRAVVVVDSAETFVLGDRMVTPRGYLAGIGNISHADE